MEFKRINMRAMILIAIAGFLILMTIFLNFKPKSTDVPNYQIQTPSMPLSVSDELVRPIKNFKTEDEDEAVQSEMKDQMDKDRNQQRRIKMLKMQLEQVNLQLDNEKAVTEINKLKKENAGYVKDSNSQVGTGFPSIRIIYIGGTDTEKEAILSIDGTSYSVKEKDRPVSNVEILSVTDKNVKVHFSAPQVLTTVINYVQE
jgi:hypothetical protein